jgi:hypothetical protein
MLGDSFVYGAGVADPDTIPARLEARLGSTWEILNLGVSGAGIEDYRSTAERFRHLEPDVTIVGVYVDNDIRLPRKDVVSRLTNLQLVRMATRALEGFGDCRYPWIKNYRVERDIQTLACQGRINPFMISRAAMGDEEAYYRTLARLFEREPVIRGDLMAIKSLWPSAHFALLIFPSSFQVSSAYLPQLKRIGELASRSTAINSSATRCRIQSKHGPPRNTLKRSMRCPGWSTLKTPPARGTTTRWTTT